MMVIEHVLAPAATCHFFLFCIRSQHTVPFVRDGPAHLLREQMGRRVSLPSVPECCCAPTRWR